MVENSENLASSEVSLQEWDRRKDFVNFTEADAILLKELAPITAEYADRVMDQLYTQILSYSETKKFFPDDATLERVKHLQKEYFFRLTDGEYGQEYLDNRLYIGHVHQRIGLEPRWYMGLYSVYMQLTFPHFLKPYTSKPKKTQQIISAFNKLINLDMELAISTYMTARVRERAMAEQAKEILEISTPVIQVLEGVVISPLIGTLDSRRTQQLMETLLEKVVESKSSVALIDITGVPTIDTQTAQHLIETISSVKLLGAQAILTGVRPAIAQTLVHLGVELSDVVTRPSLESGLTVAMEMLGLEIVKKREKYSDGARD